MTTATGAREVLHITQHLHELTTRERRISIIYVDIQAVIEIIENPVIFDKTEYSAIRYHFIRELLEREQLLIDYCPTKNMIADIFTKKLNRSLHERFTRAMITDTTEEEY